MRKTARQGRQILKQMESYYQPINVFQKVVYFGVVHFWTIVES